jgi:hypothetical protein
VNSHSVYLLQVYLVQLSSHSTLPTWVGSYFDGEDWRLTIGIYLCVQAYSLWGGSQKNEYLLMDVREQVVIVRRGYAVHLVQVYLVELRS